MLRDFTAAKHIYVACGYTDLRKSIDGLALVVQKSFQLERGNFQWPRTKEQVRQVSLQQFRWLMEGLSTEQPKALKRCANVALG